jgi:hypothetical protein
MNTIIIIRDFFQNVVLSLITLLRIPFFSRPWGKIKSIKNAGNLIILANGPSLTTSLHAHSAFLKKHNLLALNMFAASEYYTLLRPAYYVIISPDMWEDNSDERLKEKKKGLWGVLATKTQWPVTLYLPAEAKRNKEWKKWIEHNKNFSFSYFNRTPVEGFRAFKRICYRLNLGMPRPHNVLIPSLMIALNSGFKEITLLGADHSWMKEVSVTQDNTVLVNQKHFYDETTSTPQHMLKRGGVRRLHEILHKWQLAFAAYFDLEDYARSRKTKIYNATPDSFIDAFERKTDLTS